MITRETLLKSYLANKCYFPDPNNSNNLLSRDIVRKDIDDIIAAPTENQLNCPYCHDGAEDFFVHAKFCSQCGRCLK